MGNEINFYVFDYPPEEELIVRQRIEYWKAKNEKSSDSYKLVVFDIYDIIIDILEREGFMEQCFQFEKKKGMERIVKAVGNLLQIDNDAGMVVQYIKAHTPEEAIIFLTGIGKCYPILRSHKVLNNLHSVIERMPLVMFYPGKYDGQELVLFSKIKDDNYYRALRLVD